MRLALAFTLALAAAPLAAQDTRTLAEQYVRLPEVQAMWDDVFSPAGMAAQFRAGVPADIVLTPDQLERIGALLAARMGELRPELTELLIAGMTENFSQDELSALITFYQSEHGASVMSKMQPFMAHYTAQMMPKMQAVQEAVLPEILEIIGQ